jgi:hypothetical protein
LADAVQAMLAGWDSVTLDSDLAGIPRVITAVRRPTDRRSAQSPAG